MTAPVIDLDIRLPLARFPLAVRARVTGDALAVLGPSGSGKTSLLEVIAGLRPATGLLAVGGRLLLDSRAGIRIPPEARAIGYVPQDSGLFPHLDVEGNVRFGLRRGPDAEQRLREAVDMLAIGPLLRRYPRHLSGGERQRVALARALATAPSLLLLDEPLAALDLELKERVLPYLLSIRDEARIPIIHVTHNVGEALVLAREALVLKDGSVAAHGPAAEVLGSTAIAAIDPAAAFDNVLDGLISACHDASGIARLMLGPEIELAVPSTPDLRVGDRAAYSVPAEDILISTHSLHGVSARNIFAARVLGIQPIGRDALVRLAAAGCEWRARLTPAAVQELGLAPAQDVWIAIKTHAFRRLR